jgi:ABC-type nickel/cobalt efflux system permease component RcnA
MNRAAFGMVLVVAFSLGLAAVLTVVGLLFVKSSRIVQRVPRVVLTVGAAMSLGL